MKKIYIGLFIMFLLLSAILLKNQLKSNIKDNANASADVLLGDTIYLMGDVNGDDQISAQDYILIKKHILKRETLTGDKLKRADVNSNGTVSAEDYLLIKKMIIKGLTNTSVLSISLFGAKCDGKADDTQAIQNALTYASTHDVTTVDFGSGRCMISESLKVVCNTGTSNNNVRRKITITGDATIVHKDITFMTISNVCYNVTLKNFTSKSNYSSFERDINKDGKIDGGDSITHISNSNSDKTQHLNLTVENVTLDGGVTGMSLNGLASLNVNNSVFKNMHFIPEYGRGGYGILFQGCKDVIIKNSKFIADKYYRHGIYVSVSTDYPKNYNIRIDNCTFDYSNIKPVDFDALKYPKDKLPSDGGGINKSHIWSPDTTPLAIRRTDGIAISNCTMINTPNIATLNAEQGNITRARISNVTLKDPAYRPGEHNFGIFVYGRSKDGTINYVTGAVDNFQITGNIPDDYNYYAAISYAKDLAFTNVSTSNSSKLKIKSYTPNYSKITGFNGTIE